jgi:hypothetical protein
MEPKRRMAHRMKKMMATHLVRVDSRMQEEWASEDDACGEEGD